ncbi:MAG: DNA-binding protein, partial [Roseiarcus sp.]
MYYHVLIETTEKIGKSQSNRQLFDLDNTDLKEIENRIVKPFLQRDEFQIDGYFLNSTEVRRLVVKQTSSTTRELSEFENEHMPPGIIMYVSPSDIVSYDKYTKDITVE